MSEHVRPTKKQRELLGFIEAFINEHGYSPSYREIMNGLQYNSVATVALHVGNLIKRGHLRKRENSARSLEVVREGEVAPAEMGASNEQHEQWLVQRVNERLSNYDEQNRDEAQTLLNALRLLGLDESADKLALELSRAE